MASLHSLSRHLIAVVVAMVSLAVGAAGDTVHVDGNHSAHLLEQGRPQQGSTGINSLNEILVKFSLTSDQGKHASETDFRGKYLLMGFGFTHCEHVCPMMAANISRVMNKSPVEVAGVFISVDTERDTPVIAQQYASNFHANMRGFSGDYDQIATVAKNFKVSFAITKTQDNYTVQHTSYLYLIDREGDLLDIFALNADYKDILVAINHDLHD